MEQQSKESSKLLERITMNPDICHGEPCIRGLRSGGHDPGVAERWDEQPGNSQARAGCPAMKFLVDDQLPRRLARWLQAEGHEAIHTRDLPAPGSPQRHRGHRDGTE